MKDLVKKMLPTFLLDKFSSNPSQLFLIDGIGAVVSALFLGVVLVSLEAYVGMPKSILYGLASLAGVYAIISFVGYLFVKHNWRPYLRVIASANLFHCLLTIGLVIYHFQKLAPLGFTYFTIELAIVFFIVWLEFKTAAR